MDLNKNDCFHRFFYFQEKASILKESVKTSSTDIRKYRHRLALLLLQFTTPQPDHISSKSVQEDVNGRSRKNGLPICKFTNPSAYEIHKAVMGV